jgi:hypothetical protein
MRALTLSSWLRIGVGLPIGLGLLVACGSSRDGGGDPLWISASPTFEGSIGIVEPLLVPSPAFAPAADPKLEGFDRWPLVFDAAYHQVAGRACTVEVVRDGVTIREINTEPTATTCAALWDGLDDSGAVVSPGAAEVVGKVIDEAGETLVEARVPIEVVRLGITDVQLTPMGAANLRQPLLYRAMDGVAGGWYEVTAARTPWHLDRDRRDPAGAVSLELADGSPRPLPEIWSNVTSPPIDAGSTDGSDLDTYNYPTAWVAGTNVRISATLSSDIANAPRGGAPSAVQIRIVPPEGTTPESDMWFVPDGTIEVTTNETPVPAVGRYDLELAWTFEARLGEEWVPIPGEVRTTHRMYGLAAVPRFEFTGIQHRPWVDVVDQVAGWVDGASADRVEVGGAIVEGVYRELGLRYDRERGASFYTAYGSGWGSATFRLAEFQERDRGTTINCSDAGSIVSTYANMVGLDFRYHILRDWRSSSSGFDLNFIQAIGWPGFTETPFTGGRGGFSYHAVVGPSDGTFYDGTLALDGDGDPLSAPSTELLAKGMAPADYIRALSSQYAIVSAREDAQVRFTGP